MDMMTGAEADRKLSVMQVFASPGWGGGEKYAFDLSVALARDGHRVTVVSRRSDIIRNKCVGAGLQYEEMPLGGVPDLVSAWKLAHLVRSAKADIIHVHNFKDAFTAVYAAKLCGAVKVVVTRHLVRRGKKTALYRWLYRNLDAIVFVSELARGEFLSGVHSLENRATVIYNGIKADGRQEAVDVRSRYDIGKDVFLVGFTGRVVPEKGVDVLVKAVGMMQSNIAVLVAGSGDIEYVESLKQLACEHGVSDRVTFCGYVDDVESFVASVDVGVVPSIAREAFCFSAVEYIKAGKPVVASGNGAQAEYICDGQNGLLVPAGDAEALAAAFDRLAGDAALCERLGKAARQTFVDNFGYEKFYGRMMEVYRHVVSL